MEDLETVNKRLLDNYGRGVGELPAYRIVWGGSQQETRTGLYVKQTEAGIYLGESILTKDVEKYPEWKDYWILEIPQPNIANPELHASISYEPLWIFKDSVDNPLPYDWEVIEKIIYFHQHREAPKTEKAMEHDFEEAKKKEEEETLDFLKHDEPFPNKMYDSSVVTVPSNHKVH